MTSYLLSRDSYHKLTKGVLKKAYVDAVTGGSNICIGWPGTRRRMKFINIGRSLSTKNKTKFCNLDAPGWKKPDGQILSMTNKQRHQWFKNKRAA